jgi:hypothetical protein
MFNRQAAFDAAVTGIIRQGRLSGTANGNCFYRYDPSVDPNGEGEEPGAHYSTAPVRCGIGWIMPDDFWQPSFEGTAVYALPDPVLDRLGLTNQRAKDFAWALQTLHDGAIAEPMQDLEEQLVQFVDRARTFARRRRLSTTALEAAWAERSGQSQ